MLLPQYGSVKAKTLCQSQFFYVDAERLTAGYDRDAEGTERIKKCLTELYCCIKQMLFILLLLDAVRQHAKKH